MVICKSCGKECTICINCKKSKKECPYFVPKTYARNKIKIFADRLAGNNVKNKGDHEAFIDRFQKIRDIKIGEKVAIDGIRKNGEYGQEYRDALNLCVCMGLMIKSRVENDTETGYYEVWQRVENPPCKYTRMGEMKKQKCYNCNTVYPLGTLFCENENCKYQRGSKKGLERETITINNHDSFCKLEDEFFKKIGEKDGCTKKGEFFGFNQ